MEASLLFAILNFAGPCLVLIRLHDVLIQIHFDPMNPALWLSQMQRFRNPARTPSYLVPIWSFYERRFFCSKLVQCSVETRTLQRSCAAACNVWEATILQWRQRVPNVEGKPSLVSHRHTFISSCLWVKISFVSPSMPRLANASNFQPNNLFYLNRPRTSCHTFHSYGTPST